MVNDMKENDTEMERNASTDRESSSLRMHCGVDFNSAEKIILDFGESVYSETRKIGAYSVMLCVFEQLFFRVGSYASLTVMLTEADSGVDITAIGSGGGNGLFNISWGAENSYVESFKEYIESAVAEAETEAEEIK